jgi:APA family basic amino acid/polyamine antiporter
MTASSEPPGSPPPSLKRALSLPILVLYGLGTIIGAGIYVLVGKVGSVAGMHTPMAFLVAAAVALVSAFTYAELAARFPKCAGEPVYIARGLRVPYLPVVVGLLIVAGGIVSAATLARGFVGYLHVFVDVPEAAAMAGLVLALGALAAWGIAESALVAAGTTLVEVAGLVLIVWVCRGSLATLPARVDELLPSMSPAAWPPILAGAVLAFYAFIGFEDMVNVAEEARAPVRDMPRAILLASLAATALYIVVTLVAVLGVAPATLAASEAPLALLYAQATGKDPSVISIIGLVAVVNGALVQIVMAARVLYGMSREGWLPAALRAVGRRTQTPWVATAGVTAAVLVAALGFPLLTLAHATSFLILVVFTFVNLALLRLKLGAIAPPPGAIAIPAWMPALGAALSLLLLAAQSLAPSMR